MRWLIVFVPLWMLSGWLYILQPWRKAPALPAMDTEARHFRCAIFQEVGWDVDWPLAAVTYDRRWFVVTCRRWQWSVDRATGGTIVYGHYLWNRRMVRGVSADGSRTPWVLRLGNRQAIVDDLLSLGWTVDDRVHPVQVTGPPPVWWE